MNMKFYCTEEEGNGEGERERREVRVCGRCRLCGMFVSRIAILCISKNHIFDEYMNRGRRIEEEKLLWLMKPYERWYSTRRGVRSGVADIVFILRVLAADTDTHVSNFPSWCEDTQ